MQSEGVFIYVERLQTKIANQKYNKILSAFENETVKLFTYLKEDIERIYILLLVCDYTQIRQPLTVIFPRA